MSRATERPSPVPDPGGFVVKNGSNTRSRSSTGTPPAAVADLDHDVRSFCAAPHLDPAALARGVRGVLEQVRQHLHQQRRRASDRAVERRSPRRTSTPESELCAR